MTPFLEVSAAQIARGPRQYLPPFSCEICIVEAHQIEAGEAKGKKKRIETKIANVQ